MVPSTDALLLSWRYHHRENTSILPLSEGKKRLIENYGHIYHGRVRLNYKYIYYGKIKYKLEQDLNTSKLSKATISMKI